MSEHLYDAEALYGMAKRMETKARRVILNHIASYAFFGAVIGIGIWLFGPRLLGGISWLKTFAWWTSVPAMASLFGLEGYLRGRSVSTHLQFEAQRAFCEVKMEEHLAQIVKLLSDSSAQSVQSVQSTDAGVSGVPGLSTPSAQRASSAPSAKEKKPQTGHRKKG